MSEESKAGTSAADQKALDAMIADSDTGDVTRRVFQNRFSGLCPLVGRYSKFGMHRRCHSFSILVFLIRLKPAPFTWPLPFSWPIQLSRRSSLRQEITSRSKIGLSR